MEQLLKFIRENIQVSVLMHILICLSYLSKENFQHQMEECNFVDRISEFVEFYSQINTAGIWWLINCLENEAAEIDKKTVLDLCAHMFHPKDTSLDNSETLELNELKTEDRIREYENEQGELIFECFQDEVSWQSIIYKYVMLVIINSWGNQLFILININTSRCEDHKRFSLLIGFQFGYTLLFLFR